ncbi:MAG: acetyl-CoA carboxylase biotin carboxyl carrier protein, partial [Glaciimonas sp.]|nr:acetyl-CoA carboxylase biotin carboxyl carrier protein [Glaciimonas sp.]
MDLRKLKALIDLVAESDIEELEVTEGESKVRIVNSSGQQNMVMMQPQMAHPQPVQYQTGATGQAPVAAPVEVVAAVPEGHIVKSPMVGTFYRSSAPGSPASWPAETSLCC